MSNGKVCMNCNKIMAKPSNYSIRQWDNKKYCSRKCGSTSPNHKNFVKGHKHSETTKEKLSKQKLAEKNPRWKGGRFSDGHGYIVNSIGNSARRLEHRVVMEKHIGRKLDKLEHVHHINGIKDDNRIDNLIILTKSEHHKLHKIGYKHSEETKKKIRLGRWGY